MSTAPPPPPDEGASSGEDTHVPEAAPDDRARRRRSRLTVIGVAMAVLLAGGGGAYWATGSEDSSDTAGPDGPPPVLALDGYGAQEAAEPASRKAGDGPRYRATQPLPKDGPDQAPVYQGAGELDRDTVTELAKALGVPDAPELKNNSWRAGSPTEGPVFRVRDEAPNTWTYSRIADLVRPTKDTAVSSDDAPDSAAPKVTSSSEQNSERDAEPSEELVSEQRAKEAAEPVLEALGLDDAPVDASQTQGALRLVTVSPEYDGLPTDGWQTVLKINADGELSRAEGPLLATEEGAEYPVLSAEETLRELNENAPNTRTLACAQESAQDSAQSPKNETSRGASESRASAPADLAPCDNAHPAGPLEVTDAVFGLALQSSQGQPVLVPSWLFEVKSATGAQEPQTVAYPAVEPKYLEGNQPGSAADSGEGSEEDADRDPEQGTEQGSGGSQPKNPDEGQREPDTSSRQIEAYQADDRTLTLHFWGGVCTDYSGAVEESADQVQVSIVAKERNDGRNCIAIAKKLTVKVTLEEPVGSREVVDDKDRPLPKKK